MGRTSTQGLFSNAFALTAPMLGFSVLVASFAPPPATDVASTSRVSQSSSGSQADARSTGPTLSSDGRLVAFVSWATNLVPGDTNNWSDVFVRDREANTIVRASVGTGGIEAQGESWGPSISADGRYIAFASDAWNLVFGDENGVGDIFVRDLQQGTTIRASVSSSGTSANGACTNPVLSADGRFVAFESSATSLVPDDGNGDIDVFVRDLVAGTTERASVGTNGVQALGASQSPAISSDGRYVAFASMASNLVASGQDVNDSWDVFLRDRVAGTTVLVSVSSSGVQGSDASYASSVSADGLVIAFESQSSNLVAGDSNGRSDVFVRDLQSGTTTRVSIGPGGLQANGGSTRPAISADGRLVVFLSEASNLVTGDGNSVPDIFLHDRTAFTTCRVSCISGELEAHGGASWPAVSANGQWAAFPSAAMDLVGGDTNQVVDVFVRGPIQ